MWGFWQPMNLKRKTLNRWSAALSAAAVLAAAVQAPAQSVDALLDKLVEKGILTTDEAQQMRAEATPKAAPGPSIATGFPDWVTSFKIGGDFRGRFEDFTADNSAYTDRVRLRYRLRVGATVTFKENLELGLRFASADPAPGTGYGGNPVSNNTTLQDNGTKKFLYIDAAYGRWRPIHDDDWQVITTVGKMDQPFQSSSMVFDPDYTPEGAAGQVAYKLSTHHTLRFNTAAFVLDELSGSTQDPFLYGGQLLWDAKWSPRVSSAIGVTALNLVNKLGLPNSAVSNVNDGNTRDANGNLAYNFNPIVAGASATYRFDHAPLFRGEFPVKLGGEYLNNPGAPSANEGWWAGVTFGQAARKGTWEVSYRYQRLEADAWYEELVDDDNAAYYRSPVAGSGFTGGGIRGGTNVKGHLVKASYALADALTLSVTAYLNELIKPSPGDSKSEAVHFMADVLWKF